MEAVMERVTFTPKARTAIKKIENEDRDMFSRRFKRLSGLKASIMTIEHYLTPTMREEAEQANIKR